MRTGGNWIQVFSEGRGSRGGYFEEKLLYFVSQQTISMENKFGGSWTEQKISILETYAIQFLKVFKNKPNEKLLYFDGFAGSGSIELDSKNEDESRMIEGAAIKILRIENPRAFNMYYFV